MQGNLNLHVFTAGLVQSELTLLCMKCDYSGCVTLGDSGIKLLNLVEQCFYLLLLQGQKLEVLS